MLTWNRGRCLVSGFLCRWIPQMAHFPDGVWDTVSGPPSPGHHGCARALGDLFPWGFGPEGQRESVVKPSV